MFREVVPCPPTSPGSGRYSPTSAGAASGRVRYRDIAWQEPASPLSSPQSDDFDHTDSNSESKSSGLGGRSALGHVSGDEDCEIVSSYNWLGNYTKHAGVPSVLKINGKEFMNGPFPSRQDAHKAAVTIQAQEFNKHVVTEKGKTGTRVSVYICEAQSENNKIAKAQNVEIDHAGEHVVECPARIKIVLHSKKGEHICFVLNLAFLPHCSQFGIFTILFYISSFVQERMVGSSVPRVNSNMLPSAPGLLS